MNFQRNGHHRGSGSLAGYANGTEAGQAARPARSGLGRPFAHLDRSREIALAHGGGGQLSDALLQQAIVPRLDRGLLGSLLDSATLAAFGEDRPALTIDGYVVTPWRFPGGNIGHLAVCGTVNDLAVAGALPEGIALSLILEEGFPRRDLEAVLEGVAEAADAAGVQVITGDTKVVGRGAGDGVYITTAGLGRVPAARRLGPERVRPGDLLLVSGQVGEHGLAVMLAREMPEVESVLRSDCAPLNYLCEAMVEAGARTSSSCATPPEVAWPDWWPIWPRSPEPCSSSRRRPSRSAPQPGMRPRCSASIRWRWPTRAS